jgi:hypothetical protein
MKKSHISLAAALALAAASATAVAAPAADLLGSPAQSSTAQRTVNIDRGTGWVNVREGETIGFVSNGQEFAWTFQGPVNSFDLDTIAPQGMIDHSVRIHVEPLSTAA